MQMVPLCSLVMNAFYRAGADRQKRLSALCKSFFELDCGVLNKAVLDYTVLDYTVLECVVLECGVLDYH